MGPAYYNVNHVSYCNIFPTRLHSSVSRASHRYGRGHGFKSCWSLRIFFLGFISNCFICFITVRISITSILFCNANIYNLYIICTSRHSLHITGINWTCTWPQPPTRLHTCSSVGRESHGYCRGHAFKSHVASEFFLGFICNCLNYYVTARITFTCMQVLLS